MQGWRTVALRIRGAKAELEEAGEDTEGMVESTAKLRELIKGISGVDIMIDENTFKSTYQIIEELGKVWHDISDINQASLLEAIAGKRQSNIVAAALENYERLDEVLDKSVNSYGSARREQNEYAKSIQYSFDALKAAYQDFADTVVNSKTLKSLLKTGQSFLELLTAIIDKIGLLPTLLTSIGGASAFKGKNMFGDIFNLVGGKSNKGFIIDDNDVRQLRQYNALLAQGKSMGEAEAIALRNVADGTSKVSKNALELAHNANGAAVSEKVLEGATKSLTTSEKVAITATNGLKVAMTALGNMAIMAVISLVITGLTKLADKLTITKEELAETRHEFIESAQQLKEHAQALSDETKSITELVEKYKEIYKSNEDVTSKKSELVEIQNSLIEKFGDEAKSIDLVNGKYDEQIAKIKELSQKEYEKWKIENAAEIKKAQEYQNSYLDIDTVIAPAGVSTSKEFERTLKTVDKVQGTMYSTLYLIEDVAEEIQDFNVKGTGFYDGLIHNDLILSGSLEDAKNQLEEIIRLGTEQGLKSSELKPLVDRYNELNTILDSTASYMKIVREMEAPETDSVGDVTTPNLDNLATLNGAIGDVRAKWFENLKAMEDGFGKTVSTLTSTLQTLANGEGLSSTDFWNLMELDTDKIITDIQMVGDKYIVNQDQLIKLKDQYINKQIDSLKFENENLKAKQDELSVTIEQAKAEMSLLGAKGMSVDKYRKEYQEAENSIKQGEKNLKDYGEQIKRNNILIDQWSSKLGDTVDYTESLKKKQKELNDELTALNKELDDYQKAYNYIIDSRIEEEEKELAILEIQKQALQDELDILNEQKAVIEETIKNYETVNSLVQNTVQKEIDSLNEQKKAIEDTYNKRIEALKEENEQRENALEYAQKLANLENAKNNKVRVIDSTRGFRYESIKEDVVSAQNDLSSFENNQAIKQLEKERDAETAVFDNIIKDKEQYAKFWKSISEEVQTEEEEILATEILGAEWREKIAAGDIEIMEKFKTEYRSHNSALKTLTNSEIKLKEAAIKAKDAEIKAKNEQINKWKEFKNEVSKAVDNIKAKNSDYYDLVKKLEREEPLTLANRQQAFDTFSKNVSDYIGRITAKQNEINNVTSAIENVGSAIDGLTGKTVGIDVQVYGLDELQRAKDEAARLALAGALEGYNVSNIAEVVTALRTNQVTQELTDKAMEHLSRVGDMFKGWGSFSTGGVDDYTGTAMLHGRKNAPEVIFNASDAKKLYEYVHGTPNLVADAVSEISKTTGFKLSNNTNNNTNNSSVSIGTINVYANNPQELTKGLDKQLDQYFRTKLTQGYTSKN